MLNLVNPHPSGLAAPPATWSTVVIHDVAALEPYVPAWQELADAALEPNLFYEPWLMLPALRALGGRTAFRFVLVFAPHPADPGHPPVLAGFFPLEYRPTYHRLPASVLRPWVHPYGPLGTPLVRRDLAGPCLATFLQWHAADRRSAALLEFVALASDGPFYQELSAQLQAHHALALVRAETQRALFRRGDGADAYLQAALSGDQRKSLRRRAKRLAEQGRVEYRLLGPGGDLDAWFADFVRLEASGWKGRAGTALAQNPDMKAFLEDATRAALRLGRLRFFALTLNDRAIAYQLYFPAGAGAFALKTAYDEEYSRLSPGTLIQAELIRRLHEQPEFDWMDSSSEPDGYLNDFWKDRRTIQTLLVATGSLRGRLVVSALPRLLALKRRWLERSAPAPPAPQDPLPSS